MPLKKEEKENVDKKMLESCAASKVNNIKLDETYEKISHHFKFFVN